MKDKAGTGTSANRSNVLKTPLWQNTHMYINIFEYLVIYRGVQKPPSIVAENNCTMNYLVCALVLFGLIALSASTEIKLCQGVANYVFLPFVGDCSKYYVCVDGEAIQQQCTNNLMFDAKEQSCTYESQAQCLPSCTTSLSSFCYDRTCTKYVLCYGGVPVVQQCCDGLQYNAETDRCDFPQFVDCVDNLCSVYDDNPENILFLQSKASCEKYFICMDGAATPQECSVGLQFNPTCNCCDFPDNVYCNITTPFKRNITPFSKKPPRSADITCPATGVTFLPHATLPSSYYFCSNGNGVILECTPGLVYDKTMETCREPKYVKLI